MITKRSTVVTLLLSLASLAIVGLGSYQAVSHLTQADAWTTNYYQYVYAPGSLDRFMNYDGGQPGWSSNVDWPIRYLWKNNAEIDKVKNKIDGCGGDPNLSFQTCSSGGPMHLHMVLGGPGDFYDSDTGKKGGRNCTWDQHMRFYADPNTDFNVNQTWGHYILSSSHRDHEHILGAITYCSGTYTSTEGSATYPDESEAFWNLRMIYLNTNYLTPDWTILTNSLWLLNPETYGWKDGSHLAESNGWGSIIDVQ